MCECATTKCVIDFPKFQELIDSKGLKIYGVSQLTGGKVSTATLYSWKKGEYVPKLSTLSILAEALEVPLSTFIGE